MNKISPQTRFRLFLLILAMIVVTVGSAFSIVWMQQQISRSAQRIQSHESQYAESIRRISYLDQRIATMHQPVVLQGKVAGTLRPSMENQVVWVHERSLPSGRAYAVAEPYEASMDLAFVNLNPQQ